MILSQPSHTSPTIIVEGHAQSDHDGLIAWLQRGRWCSALEVPAETRHEALQTLASRGFGLAATVHAHPDTRRRFAEYVKRPDLRPHQVAERFGRAADDTPVYLFVFLEDDSAGVGFPQVLLTERPRTHAQADRLWRKYLARAGSHVPDTPGVVTLGMIGFEGSAHALAATGVDAILIERANDDVPDLQSGVAFARGAARQHGCLWGVDLSIWWGPIYGCVQDLPASVHRRHLYLAYFAGAELYRIEGGNILWDYTRNVPRAVATELDRFGQFARTHDPGTPDVPVAVMLSDDNGWINPPYWRADQTAWHYARVPQRYGDAAVDAFFALAFPGSNAGMNPFPFGAYTSDDPPASPFALACIGEDFAPTADAVRKTPSPIPFGRYTDRHHARDAMHARNIDPSPYRPMGDSRWGDLVDAITAAASTETLGAYRVILLLGHVAIDDALWDRLCTCMDAGGHVVMAITHLSPRHEALDGLEVAPELRLARAWTWPGEAPVHEPIMHVPVTIPTLPADITVLAHTPDGEPLVVRRAWGRGALTVSFNPGHQPMRPGLSRLAIRLFDHVIADVQPVHIDGLPVQVLSTTGDHHKTVVICNHSGSPWRGTVTLAQPPQPHTRCTELIEQTRQPCTTYDGRITSDLTVPPYDLRILRWER